MQPALSEAEKQDVPEVSAGQEESPKEEASKQADSKDIEAAKVLEGMRTSNIKDIVVNMTVHE